MQGTLVHFICWRCPIAVVLASSCNILAQDAKYSSKTDDKSEGEAVKQQNVQMKEMGVTIRTNN
jgi:hypothetical protein